MDRGGKGILIGGANEFQEYAWGYYGIKSPLQTSDVKKVSEFIGSFGSDFSV